MLIAFDRSSARHVDSVGRLHVSRSHISKATVNPYYGEEIPGWQELGLDPKKVYQLLRDPAELEAGAATFSNLPILSKHVPVSAESIPKELIIGSIGSDVSFTAPYLDASLCFWTAEAIAAIETETIEQLSSAYKYVPDMTPGEYEGVRYDGRMTQIEGNHLALVEVGRAGSDVVVADQNPFAKETPAMKQTKLGRALLAAIAAASPKIAQDAALSQLVGAATKKLDKKKTVSAIVAMDAELDAEQLDNIIDAILGVEQEPQPTEPQGIGEPTEDADPLAEFLKSKGLSDEDVARACELAKPAPAEDEDPLENAEPGAPEAPEKPQPNLEAAMDAMRAEFKALEVAKHDVRATVGDVIGMDSAEQVYRFALDHMGIDHKDMPAKGLAKLYKVAAERTPAPAPRIASDAATVKQFPGLARFKGN